MTYIVGFSAGGINSIISDMRVTYRNTLGKNVALKTGLLFPGCIFGRVGNDQESRKFILEAKRTIASKGAWNSTRGFWQEFQSFAESYPFSLSSTDQFQLLLSTRFSGNPQFYTLDPLNGVVQCDCSDSKPLTCGTGKHILDECVYEEYVSKITEIDQMLSDRLGSGHYELYPYLLSLWLTERAQSYEQSELENYGVGGVFHFRFQTSGGEGNQKPTFYIVVDAKSKQKTLIGWQYRVSFVDEWLVVETGIPPNQVQSYPDGTKVIEGFLDEASLPPSPDKAWDTSKLTQDFGPSISKQLETQPLYFFCGIGYMNPKHRKGGFQFHFTTEGEYIIDDTGIKPEIVEMIGDQVVSSEILDLLDAGRYLYENKHFGEAKAHCLEALAACREAHKDQFEVDTLANLGLVYRATNEAEKAMVVWLIMLMLALKNPSIGTSEMILSEIRKMKNTDPKFLKTVTRLLHSDGNLIRQATGQDYNLSGLAAINWQSVFRALDSQLQ